MRHGFGSLYFSNSNICYKGLWCNNMSDGYGEEYDIHGKLIYKGQWSYNNKIN